jgi:hypothetical protein
VVDWGSVNIEIENNINLNISLKTPEELDCGVKYFTDIIQQAIWNNTTPYKKQTSQRPLDLPLDVSNLIFLKRWARRNWQSTRYPSDKRTLNRLTRELHDKLEQLNSERHQEYTRLLTTEDRSLWSATKRILKYKNFSSPLQTDGSWAKSDEEKACLFGQHLRTTFTCHRDIIDPQHEAHIQEQLTTPLQLSPPPKAFCPSDVSYVIRNLPNRKAPGYDLITAAILKRLPKKAIIFLTYLYNAILRTTHFPLLWKLSIVKMIPKPSKPLHLPSSYRPISLLPILGKIFEKLLLRRLYPIINSHNLLPDHQFGFRFSHSSIHQCHRVVDVISSSLERKQYCPAVFLDVAQAFDRVWHAGLLSKLKPILPFTYYLILKSYLSDRYFRVSQGSAFSPYLPVLAGVPQGSILGPFLYSLYTADVPVHPLTTFCTFADDVAILSSDTNPATASNTLQSQLGLLESWSQLWGIKFNETKCTHVTFTLRKEPCPPLYLNNVQIPVADVVRYLGLYIDKRLTWNPHTRLKRKQVNTRYRMLLRLLDNRSHLTLSHKLLIYNTILKPTWTYGLELWGSTKPSNLSRIQSLQSKILRKIANAPYYVSNLTLHNDLHVPFVKDLSKTRYNKFHSFLRSHPNTLVQQLSSRTLPDNPIRRLKRQWPRDLLDQ